ncbi:MAG: hypothetical protein HDR03_10470 [Lachnospiraceae bacterium]|nr:hypothetical protein [Lachnospiraceae bacterium]
MSESNIVQELENMAETYSTDYVTITTDKERIHFECMDEWEYMGDTVNFRSLTVHLINR